MVRASKIGATKESKAFLKREIIIDFFVPVVCPEALEDHCGKDGILL
jgi:hypothetical protein